MAGTGLPLVGIGLDEEPTIVPQLFIPVGPENGGLSGARSGSTAGGPWNRVNPRTPWLMTRKPTERPRSLIAKRLRVPAHAERAHAGGRLPDEGDWREWRGSVGDADDGETIVYAEGLAARTSERPEVDL